MYLFIDAIVSSALNVEPLADDHILAFLEDGPEVGPHEAGPAVPAAVLVDHHVVLAGHQLVAVTVLQGSFFFQ